MMSANMGHHDKGKRAAQLVVPTHRYLHVHRTKTEAHPHIHIPHGYNPQQVTTIMSSATLWISKMMIMWRFKTDLDKHIGVKPAGIGGGGFVCWAKWDRQRGQFPHRVNLSNSREVELGWTNGITGLCG